MMNSYGERTIQKTKVQPPFLHSFPFRMLPSFGNPNYSLWIPLALSFIDYALFCFIHTLQNLTPVSLAVPFLPVRDDFHPKRNQARQKLATLPKTRFKDLSGDVFHELGRRYPEFRETEVRCLDSTILTHCDKALVAFGRLITVVYARFCPIRRLQPRTMMIWISPPRISPSLLETPLDNHCNPKPDSSAAADDPVRRTTVDGQAKTFMDSITTKIVHSAAAAVLARMLLSATYIRLLPEEDHRRML